MKAIDADESKSITDRIEDIFMAITYAEAADWKDVLNIFKVEADLAHPDECRCGGKDLCYPKS